MIQLPTHKTVFLILACFAVLAAATWIEGCEPHECKQQSASAQ